jgi:hypothetical protein
MYVNPKKSESFCQIFCISFLKKLQNSGCDFLVWSTPNGGTRNKAEAGKLKLEGLLPGVADIQLMAAGIVHFIEFKTNSGVLSHAQKDFIAAANRYGFGVTVVRGDTVAEVLPQVMTVMREVFNIPQNGMSSISASVLDDAARFSRASGSDKST